MGGVITRNERASNTATPRHTQAREIRDPSRAVIVFTLLFTIRVPCLVGKVTGGDSEKDRGVIEPTDAVRFRVAENYTIFSRVLRLKRLKVERMTYAIIKLLPQ
jgi:hypothetical protein